MSQTDKAVAQLIDVLKDGAKALPETVNTMVHQYVLSNAIGAAITMSVSLVLMFAAYRMMKTGIKMVQNNDGYEHPEIFSYIAAAVLSFVALMMFIQSMSALDNAINPLYNIISGIAK